MFLIKFRHCGMSPGSSPSMSTGERLSSGMLDKTAAYAMEENLSCGSFLFRHVEEVGRITNGLKSREYCREKMKIES